MCPGRPTLRALLPLHGRNLLVQIYGVRLSLGREDVPSEAEGAAVCVRAAKQGMRPGAVRLVRSQRAGRSHEEARRCALRVWLPELLVAARRLQGCGSRQEPAGGGGVRSLRRRRYWPGRIRHRVPGRTYYPRRRRAPRGPSRRRVRPGVQQLVPIYPPRAGRHLGRRGHLRQPEPIHQPRVRERQARLQHHAQDPVRKRRLPD